MIFNKAHSLFYIVDNLIIRNSEFDIRNLLIINMENLSITKAILIISL